MAALTIQVIDEDGLEASYAAASGGGDSAANGKGDVVLHAKNASGGALTVTVTAQSTTRSVAGYGDLTKGDASVSVPAAGEAFLGPFPRDAFNDASGDIAITYPGGVTSLTIAALRVPRT